MKLAVTAALVVTAIAGASALPARGSEPAGPPTGKIRVANFFLVNRVKPGPALDFYDVSQPSKTDKPLISHLSYGQISSYVSPRADAGYSNLYIFPAGSKTWGKPLDSLRSGTNISNSGWVQGQQETVVMGTSTDVNQPTFAEVAEVEPKSADLKTMLLKPAGGKGLLAINVNGLIEGTAKYGDIDLRIDGACPDNTLTTGKPAQDSSNPTTPAALANYNAADFPLSLGSHKLNVVAEPGPGSGLDQQQCAGAPAKASLAVKISKAQPTLVFIYGASPGAPKTLVAHVG
jgi:hypothetical protein